MSPSPCPKCGSQPDIDECSIPGTGWYACCYKPSDTPDEEHCVAVNAATRSEAIEAWNKEVELVAQTMAGPD